VNEVSDEFGFADEIFDELFLARVILPDDFDGDPFYKFARAVLFRFVDDSHAAFENFADNVVTKFILDYEERHEPMFNKRGFKSSLTFGRGSDKALIFPHFF
jgi:hypothetical protein